MLLLLLLSSEGSVLHEKSSRVPFTGAAALCSTTFGALAKLLELDTFTVPFVFIWIHAVALK